MSFKNGLKILAFCFLSVSAFAQGANEKKGNATISGTIIDSTSKSPVEFAAVALWNASKAIDGTLTDTQGAFKFQNVAKGTYKVLVSSIGYKAQSIENVVISSDNQKLDLGNLTLSSDNIQLDEVKVVGQAALVEDKIDRLVYNADKDISNRGGTAENVLRKVPMLSVDLDGNVELRGSENVRVLINNKPSSIFASSVGEALQQIPADQIKSVEVITAPSARYDGEGTAGIVNIILKKNTLAGVTGSVSTGVGFMGSFLNGNLNMRDRKWGISLNGGGRYSYNFKSTGENTRTSVVDGETTFLNQTSDNRGNWHHGSYRATFDYDFDENTNFTISYSRRGRGSGSKGDQYTILRDINDAIIYDKTRYIDQKGLSNSNDLDFTFQKKYKNPDQELRIRGQYSQNNTISDYIADQNEAPSDSSKNKGFDREYEVRLDYVQPLGEKVKWEMGGRVELGESSSNGRFYSYNSDLNRFELNNSRSNTLDYFKNEYAVYSSFTVELPQKWGLQAGARYEKTTIDATFSEDSNVDIPGYNNLLPSVILSKRFEKGGSVRGSYTQRIQRPSIRYLNPFTNYSNTTNISSGNPYLSPELVDMFEVAYNMYVKRNSFNFSLYTRLENNSITQLNRVIMMDGVSITETTYDNIGVNRSYGLDFSYNLNPTQKLRIGGGLSPNYAYMATDVRSGEGWNMSARLNSSYSFEHGWAASLFAFYRSPRVRLQGTENGFYFHGITVKKDINERGSIGFGLENPFVKSINFKSSSSDFTNPEATYTQVNTSQMFRRSVRLDFQYRFGKLENDGKGLFNRRRGGNDDDRREDDGDGQMMR
ncbi:TonB-dependent receptor [Marinilongibacter aquaticus]|uniref:TonB-dependent receptor domain-containing protein n=1 Tax=Marinilongibacter aquaticus TaxID=2975157 RepID=UPI0021BD4042|nr:TonB-dependent receptor [Marinilongibacter aquaticus]UBM60463.1 TonB-dependent receptor [Marinilongibacter aquaticus]